MTEHGDSHSDDELQKNAVAKKAAEAEKKAKEKALEDDQRNEGGPPPAYTGDHTSDHTSLMPLTSGRAIFEAFYLAFIKPYYLWTTATQYPFLAAYPRPENWSVKQTKVDGDGIPILNSAGEPLEEYQNEYRRRWYPRAHFVSQARYDQYEQGIIDSGESMYIALWAIHVRQSRWGDPAVEAILANDRFWYRRYLSDLRDDDEESGSVVTTSDGSTPPSSPGLASVEA